MELYLEITRETLNSHQKRVEYFQFLNQHPGLTPSQIIFGVATKGPVASVKIESQIKKLSKVTHPDMAPEGPERDLNNQLFQIFQQAQASAETSKVSCEPQQAVVKNELFLIIDINSEKWKRAESEYSQYSEYPTHLGALIYLKLGDLDRGIQLLHDDHQPLKGLWTECKTLLELFERQPSPEIAGELVKLNERLHAATGSLVGSDLQPNIVPYLLPLALANWFGDKNSLNYEKFLREAIRYCPDGLIEPDGQGGVVETKKRLVDRLVDHVQMCHGVSFDEVCRIDVRAEMEQRVKTVQQRAVNRLKVRGELGKANQIKNAKAISQIVAMMEQEVSPGWREKARDWPVFGSVVAPSADQDIFKREMMQDLEELKGFESYLRHGKVGAAAEAFERLQRPDLAGLMRFAEHSYSTAIFYWKQSADTSDYIYRGINYCDSLIIAEASNFSWQRLGPVDLRELEILRQHQR
jgi:hypothetical protein